MDRVDGAIFPSVCPSIQKIPREDGQIAKEAWDECEVLVLL
jgi:hypothetical protein